MKINKTNILMDFFSLIFGFMTFICCFFEMKSVIYIKDKVEKYIIGSDFEPIVNITISRSRCETENGFYPILNYKFKGIDENCYDVNNHKFLNESCTNSKKFYTVNEINERTINIWRERNVCAKKVKNNTEGYVFYLENIFDFRLEIENKTTKCGFLNKFINVKEKNISIIKKVFVGGKDVSFCPINSININKSIENDINDSNYTIDYFYNGFVLNFSRVNDKGNVLTDLEISENKPCLEKERKSSRYVQFPMLKDLKYYNCNRDKDSYYSNYDDDDSSDNGFDDRFIPFDNVSKFQLFKDNNLDILYNNLPNIPEWDNDLYNSTFFLFYRSFYLDKNSCDHFSDYDNSINKLFNLHYGRLCLNLGNLLILIIFIVILGLMKFVLAICHSLIFCLKLIILFFIFIINIIIIGYSKNLFSDDVKNFLDYNNYNFTNYTDNYTENYTINNKQNYKYNYN